MPTVMRRRGLRRRTGLLVVGAVRVVLHRARNASAGKGDRLMFLKAMHLGFNRKYQVPYALTCVLTRAWQTLYCNLTSQGDT